MSVQVEASADQPARGVSAAFDLRGDGERGELRLNSPLGTLIAQAQWSPGEAALLTSDGVTRFNDLDELAREALGEALPLRALPDWLAGRPWAGAPNLKLATGFEQLGWQIVLTRRHEGLIDARRAAPPVVTLRARLESPP